MKILFPYGWGERDTADAKKVDDTTYQWDAVATDGKPVILRYDSAKDLMMAYPKAGNSIIPIIYRRRTDEHK